MLAQNKRGESGWWFQPKYAWKSTKVVENMSTPTKKSENVDALKQMMRFAIQVEQCGKANLTAKFWKGQHHGPGIGRCTGRSKYIHGVQTITFWCVWSKNDIDFIEDLQRTIGIPGRKIRILNLLNRLIPIKYWESSESSSLRRLLKLWKNHEGFDRPSYPCSSPEIFWSIPTASVLSYASPGGNYTAARALGQGGVRKWTKMHKTY